MLAVTGTVLLATTGALVVQVSASAAVEPCGPASNAIVCENSKDGTPRDVWDVDGAGDPDIQGFATDISVNVGKKIDFKIKTTATNYSITIYRLGYYDGDGAREIDTVPSTPHPNQPSCVSHTSTEIFDCGTWEVSGSWTVPADAVSGVYIARLQRPGANDGSHIPFIVRNDASHSDLFFQTSDTTWQAYNTYGGSSFYTGGDNGRAYKLSYNRPFATRGGVTARDYLFSNEYPMIRFLEENGYDVSYTTGVDSDRRGELIKNHKAFLSVGHDEYWSKDQRENVEAARDAGVNLAFFSGNEVYWKTRWEESVDEHGTAYRTLVTYKETWADDKIDPSDEWTGTWRDPRFSPPSDGGKPENALTGTIFMSNNASFAMKVPAAQGKLRFWRNTGVAKLTGDAVATLAPNTVGYESDEDLDNGFRPAGLIRLSTTTAETPEYVQDFGKVVLPGTTTHHMTMYRAPSGALVFGAGTIQWAWGLSEVHDGQVADADEDMQQATVNLLADMDAAPVTPMSGIDVTPASTDTVAPTATITTPANAATVANGSQVTISGTATDTGGVVAGIEVSTDNGDTWHPADGTTSWSYKFYAAGLGTQTLKVRATDDSGNIQGTPASRTLNLTGKVTLFGDRVPKTPVWNESSPYELGVKVVPQTDGYISGVRFYKGEGNTGTHVGTLWSADGEELATGTFGDETATGWQTLNFATAVPVTAGTQYVASYYAPNGHYAGDAQAFVFSDFVSGPLVAPRSSSVGGNGVFNQGKGFPNSSYDNTNYYVDVLFVDNGSSAPVVVANTPGAGATGVAATVKPTATFSKAVESSSVEFAVKKKSDGSAVAGTAAYNATTRVVTFTPSAALASATEYTATVTAEDGNGNEAEKSWSFTTDVDTTTVARLFPDTLSPQTPATTDGNPVSLGTKIIPATSGKIIGIRFYQGPGNSGAHTGTLWDSGGTELRKVSFGSSTATGWQTALFSSPVNVTGGQTYVVSYFAPNGRYAITPNFFDNTYTNGPLTAPAGVNGVYAYGGDTFPDGSYNSTNYWVDALFVANEGGGDPTPTPTTEAPSPTPTTPSPTPTTEAPSPTPTTAAPSPTPTGQPVTLPAGAQTIYGADYTPANSSWNDAAELELGVRFKSDVAGKVLGVRFYKGAQNIGTHTGTLWTDGGDQIRTGTFANETATGWQNLIFDSPVTLTPNTWYVVSYHTTTGFYAITQNQLADHVVNAPLTAEMYGSRYMYGTGQQFPGNASTHNYGVDVIFKADAS
ncbi:hypothetical protein ACTI_47160 [Actinoplanes sp. OR16]|uniref:DUF4082 domain-containing protein n=1 Tax=Actinoplanes sp. OR16 TaxID=946334 RepID=UPI000F6F4A79|nr:DUF4082 domain-containing protein [Actinoplanes sp. OR16]BBH68031.1 hypothetical protein ACTI_47160 [Actinoplanes sp. OR16]